MTGFHPPPVHDSGLKPLQVKGERPKFHNDMDSKLIKGNFKELCDKLTLIDTLIENGRSVEIGYENYDLGDFPGTGRVYRVYIPIEKDIAKDFLLTYRNAVKEKIKEYTNRNEF